MQNEAKMDKLEKLTAEHEEDSEGKDIDGVKSELAQALSMLESHCR